ncbi:hypothetical protein P3S68_011099 [Capsicum galapagoense]
MEARLVGEQKQLKDSIAALVSHMQSGQTILPALPAAISNIITTSSNSNEAGPTSVMNGIMDLFTTNAAWDMEMLFLLLL